MAILDIIVYRGIPFLSCVQVWCYQGVELLVRDVETIYNDQS